MSKGPSPQVMMRLVTASLIAITVAIGLVLYRAVVPPPAPPDDAIEQQEVVDEPGATDEEGGAPAGAGAQPRPGVVEDP